MDKKICFILRGIPGSGKSYLAKKILEEYNVTYAGHVFSTDDFWIPNTRKLLNEGVSVDEADEINEYRAAFDIDKLGYAHKNNQKLFSEACSNGTTPIIVDNTNTTKKEMQNYCECAVMSGYEVIIKEPSSKWWLEYSPYLKNKSKEPKKLDRFAELLYSKNKHGVPLDVIKKMINRWDADVTVEKLVG